MHAFVAQARAKAFKAGMTRTFLLAAALLLGSAGTAAAQDAGPGTDAAPTVVYELFTSQGCSSCPPANRQITRIADEPGVLALSYGVTYWDYLGWKDTFARPEFTQRQRDYVRAMGARNAYTPQIVVNGARHDSRIGGLEGSETLARDVSLAPKGGKILADGDGRAVLVAYTPGSQDVPVARGENGGRTLRLTNVVTEVEEVRLPHSFTPSDGQAYALIQHGERARITSAATWSP